MTKERININDITTYFKLIKKSDLTSDTRLSMIKLFKKTEPDIIAKIPQFFTKSGRFLGFKDSDYPNNTYITLLYSGSDNLNNRNSQKHTATYRKRKSKTQKRNSVKLKTSIHKRELIGFMVFNDVMHKKKYFLPQLKDIINKQGSKPGIYINWICGNNKYKGVVSILMNYLNTYLSNLKNPLVTELSKYKYILGLIEISRSYAGKLLTLYKKAGFTKTGVVSIYNKNDFYLIIKQL